VLGSVFTVILQHFSSKRLKTIEQLLKTSEREVQSSIDRAMHVYRAKFDAAFEIHKRLWGHLVSCL
jgi:hypothetical protein